MSGRDFSLRILSTLQLIICQNFSKSCQVVVWHSGSVVGHINLVTLLLQVRLVVLRWVTARGYTLSVCNQALRPTQYPTLSGTGNKYQPLDNGCALRLGR